MAVCGGLSRIEKAVFQCISTYNYVTKRLNTHGDRWTSSSWYMQQKTNNCSRTRWLFVGVFYALKRLDFSVLAHIITSQKRWILTEIDEPPPPGTCNKNPQLLENTAVVFGGLSCFVRPDLCESVHVFTSQNGPILTEVKTKCTGHWAIVVVPITWSCWVEGVEVRKVSSNPWKQMCEHLISRVFKGPVEVIAWWLRQNQCDGSRCR